MKYTPRPLEGNVNVTPTSPLKELFLLLGGMLGIVLILYVVLGFAVDLIIPRLPSGFERYLGQLYVSTLTQDTTSEAENYLQELFVDLASSTEDLPDTSYQVHILPSAQANALALPGGHILILSALLAEVQSENELAFILAHELGHFAHRDHLRGLGRGLVITALSAILVGVDNTLTNFLMRSLLTVEMKFSQRQETQADLFALDLLQAHYGHISGATDFFEKIAQKDTRSRLAYFFATHPYPQDRINKLQQTIQAQGYRTGEKRALNAVLNELPPPDTLKKWSLKDIFSGKHSR